MRYWTESGLHSKPLGKFYVHVMVHVKEMTQTVAVDGRAMMITTFAGMDFIGTSVGTDPQDYTSDHPFESHFEMGIPVQKYVVITSLPLVDLRDLVQQEVWEILSELFRISREWTRVSGVAEPALIETTAGLGAAQPLIIHRLQKAAGEALRQALQKLSTISRSGAVQDQRLKSLAGEIDMQRERLAQVAKLFD